MLRIAVCDDDAGDLAVVRHALELYCAHHPDIKLSVQEFANALDCAEGLERLPGFDVLLLDICMPGLLGTEIAREVRNRNSSLQIVFLTSSEDYAVEAFALKAAHYLLKPFSQGNFEEALSVALERIGAQVDERVFVKVRGGQVYALDADKVVYVEGNRHSQNVHFSDGSIVEVRQTLMELLDMLEGIDPGRFIVPYKGYIVNLSHVRSIDSQSVSLDDGSAVPIVKNSYKSVKDRFFGYAFRDTQLPGGASSR